MTWGRIRTSLLLFLFVFYALALVAIYIPARRFGRHRVADWLQLRFHRALVAAIGVRITVNGRPSPARPMMIVSNHASWLDIIAYSSLMPVTFIAKSEVAGWPLFGTLARLQRSVFVERQRRGATSGKASEIGRRMAAGEAMILFAEGTTSDGERVLPFRSSLVEAARLAIDEAHPEVVIQPAAVAYTRLHGLPLGRRWRHLVSWIGDEDLMPHLGAFLREGAFDISVSFGEPIRFAGSSDRKRVAEAAEREVRRLLTREIRGR